MQIMQSWINLFKLWDKYGKPFVAIFNNCIYCIQFLKYAHKRQQFIVQ